ncbi:MAG: hypothetical protein C0412_08015 [Flavobacterium sp.]|nr:hypothetical protein [Flavobacterium sp.]
MVPLSGIIQNLIDGKINGTDASKQNDLVERAKKYLKEKYYDFGPTLASKKLDKLVKYIPRFNVKFAVAPKNSFARTTTKRNQY